MILNNNITKPEHMNFGEGLQLIDKSKNILFRRISVKTESLNIKINNKTNRVFQKCILEDINSIVEYIEILIKIEEEIRKYMIENKLSKVDKIGLNSALFIIEATLLADNYKKKAA